MKTHTLCTNTNNAFVTSAMRHALLTMALAAGLLFCPGNARAGITYNFDTVIPGETWSGGNVATLNIAQVGSNTQWALFADWGNAYNVTSPFINSIQYKMISGSSITQSSLPLTQILGTVALKNRTSFGSSGVDFQTSNGSGRFTDGEAVGWTFLNTQIDDFSKLVLQVNSITGTGGSLKFIGTDPAPVPEPGQVAASILLIAGITGFVIMKRRKEASEALEALAA